MSEAFQEAMKKRKIYQSLDKYNSVHLEDFERSGLFETSARKAGYRSANDGWEVPITNPFTREVYYYRKRLDKPIKDKKEDREIKYLTPPGCEPHLYFSLLIDNWPAIFSNPFLPIILTEGEKKADKAIQEGFICVAVSGVWCWSSNHEPISDLKFICTKGRPILIAFDSDYKDKPQVQRAINELKEVITNYGYSN